MKPDRSSSRDAGQRGFVRRPRPCGAGATSPLAANGLPGVAAGNGAPEDVLTRLRSFEGRHFEDANAVAQALTQGRD